MMLGFILKGKKAKDEKGMPARQSSGEIAVRGKLKSPARLKEELSKLPIFSDVKEEGEGLSALIVESADKDKRPHLFIRLAFMPASAKAAFSIPSEVPNPLARKLHVTKTVFTLLSLLEERDAFIPDKEDLYEKTMETLEIGSEFAEAEPLRMKYDLDRYCADNATMKAELSALKGEKEGLDHQLIELEKRCVALEDRVRHLEGMTDNELDREIIRWDEVHGGKLEDEGFCLAMRITGQRLEERLDSLSKRGVIRIV